MTAEIPLGTVIKLTTRQQEIRRAICREVIRDLKATSERLVTAARAVAATGIWREFTLRRGPLSPNLEAHLEGADPVVASILKIHHQLLTAASALKARVEKDPPDV